MPFIVFMVLFTALHRAFYQAPAPAKSGFALFSCLVAVACSFATFPAKTPFNSKMLTFIQGAAQPSIIYMAYIFIMSSVFTHFVIKNGGIESAVTLGLHLIPAWAVLPGLFIAISLFALTIGTSMGTIAAFTPIALGFGHKLAIAPELIAALVVSGAMLGDNLSLISDTTIAAAQTTGCTMSDKFRHNGMLVLGAFVCTLILLTSMSFQTVGACPLPLSGCSLKDVINILPYLIIFVLALTGIDVLAVLLVGIMTAASIGLWYGNFDFLQATGYLFQGFYCQPDMVNVLMLVMFIAGLAHIIDRNGGIRYLLSRWQLKVATEQGVELTIAFLAFVVNAAIVINTITILIVGPVAKALGESRGISKARIASLLDIFSCICQGLMPYSPQLLLASAMARVSSVSLVPYMYYQYILGVITLISIAQKYKRSGN